MARWTALDDNRLSVLYETWAGEVIPIDKIAKILDRTPGAVRYRAHKLELTDPARPRAGRGRTKQPVADRECAQCGNLFTPRKASDPQQTCSRSCAARKRSSGGRWHNAKFKAGKRPDLGEHTFRSAWEANYARYLNWLQARGKVTSWEYEPHVFRFPVQRGNRGYMPDFKVHLSDGTYEWHEVKGYMDDASRIKLQRFALHHPEESARLVLIDKTRYQQLKKDFSERLPGWE